MRKFFVLFLMTTTCFFVSVCSAYAASAGGNGNQGGGGGSTGGGTSCSYPVDAGKNVDTKTYLFDLVQRKKGSTNFKHLGCVIVGKEAKNVMYDKSVHKNCKIYTSLGDKANAEKLRNIAKYLSEGKDLSGLNSSLKKHPEYARTYARVFDDKYKGTGFDENFDPEKNTDFGGSYGYRILIQKFIYIGCSGNWTKYVVPRKEAYRQDTGLTKKVSGLNIFGQSRQDDLYTTKKDIGITKGKKVSNASKSNFTNKNDGTGYNIIWFNTDDVEKKHDCVVYKNNKGTTKYYDKADKKNGKISKEYEIKIIKGAQFSKENRYQIPKNPSDKGYTLREVKQYINEGCKTLTHKCEYTGGKCYDRLNHTVNCNSSKGSWIKAGCPSCWYDSTNDVYYTDASGDGSDIRASLKRDVYNVPVNGNSWGGFSSSGGAARDCATRYHNDGQNGSASTSYTTNYPSTPRHCNSSTDTSDCTYSSNDGYNVECSKYIRDCTKTTCAKRGSKCIQRGSTCIDPNGACMKYGPCPKNKKGKCKGPAPCVKRACAQYNCEEYECSEWNYASCLRHAGTYPFRTSWGTKKFKEKEYYIWGNPYNPGWQNKAQANSWISNNCKLLPKTCSIDMENSGAWFDQYGNYHTSGLTKKVALWINSGRCNNNTRTKTSVTCSNCNSTSREGGGYTISESKNWNEILGSYYGTNKENEDDSIENHFVQEENDTDDQVYCSESLSVKLPNGQTTNLNSAISGRYITVNLGDSYDDIMNLTPITLTKTKTCRAINNSEVSSSTASGINNLSQLYSYSANNLLYNYMQREKENAVNPNGDDNLGGISLSYSDGTYNYTDELEKHMVQNTLLGSGNEYTLTQVVNFTLAKDVYRYISNLDGSASRYVPNDISKYTDLGFSTLPVKFETPFSANITFNFDYSGTTFEDEFDDTSTWIDSSSLNCASNMKNSSYYTCKVSNSTKVNQNKCKIQKTDNGVRYYYNYREVSESTYRSNCSCFEKNGNYYLKGNQISKEEYETVCPSQCSTVCPAGEVCCPTGGSNMPCSVNGVCPTTGGNSKLIYRTIDLKNPFTGQNTRKQGRKTGSNWCSYNIKSGILNCENLNDGLSGIKNTSSKNNIVYKHIKKNAGALEDDIYRQKPQYSITLDSRTIDKVRTYNEKQKNKGGYDDFTLNCYDVDTTNISIRNNLKNNGIYTTNVCQSNFLRDGNIINNLSGNCASGKISDLLVCSEKNVN